MSCCDKPLLMRCPIQLLNRRPPFGHEVLAFLKELPVYEVSISLRRNGITSYSGRKPVAVDLDIQCGLLQELGKAKSKSKHKHRNFGATNVLTLTSDLDFIDFRRISLAFSSAICIYTLTTNQYKGSRRPKVVRCHRASHEA